MDNYRFWYVYYAQYYKINILGNLIAFEVFVIFKKVINSTLINLEVFNNNYLL